MQGNVAELGAQRNGPCPRFGRTLLASEMRVDRTVDEYSSGPYQLFMLVLCIYALGALFAEHFASLDPGTQQILRWSDNVICALFLVDFLVHLARAPDRWRYFRTWGWIDLLSSIPVVDALRVGRAARVVRILRIFRAIRSMRLLVLFILARRAQGAALAAALISLLLVVAGSIAILQLEQAGDANIRTPEDALWWAITTITTVGYGDRYPVTTAGRVVAGLLMTAGVGLFGTFSGFVAHWFLSPGEEKQDDEVKLLRRDIAELRELIERNASLRG